MPFLGAPSIEEQEVCLQLQECLKLREKYVFRETVKPWDSKYKPLFPTGNLSADRSPFADKQQPQASKVGEDKRSPLSPAISYLAAQQTSLIFSLQHVFFMEDGVVRVFADDKSGLPYVPPSVLTTLSTI